MTTNGKLRGLFSPSRILAYSFALIGAVAVAALIFAPQAARAADCAELGGSIQRDAFSPSSHGLQGTPGSIYSCVDAAGVELKSYGLSGI